MGTTFTNLANAIAKLEQSTWPNNPGALEDAQGNHLDFGSPEAGFQALLDKLTFDASGQSKVYNPDMSLQDFETTYTGGDTKAGGTLSKLLGVSPSTPLSQLNDQSLGGAQTPNSSGASTPFSLLNP
jgi:hypothetical protein